MKISTNYHRALCPIWQILFEFVGFWDLYFVFFSTNVRNEETVGHIGWDHREIFTLSQVYSESCQTSKMSKNG